MAQEQDVYFYFDELDRGCVELYAKALKIVDGNDPDKLEYLSCPVRPCADQQVYHAKVVGDIKLDVTGETKNLTPNIQYNVYLNMNVPPNLTLNFMCDIIDQKNNPTHSSMLLMPGDFKVLAGQFTSTTTTASVTVRLYEKEKKDKNGLVIRCISIVPFNN